MRYLSSSLRDGGTSVAVGPTPNPGNPPVDPTLPGSQNPNAVKSFYEQNKDLILYGGLGLAGVIAFYYASKKGKKRRSKR